jgi:hypothetical protein
MPDLTDADACVFVFAIDNGTEGLSAPFQVVADEVTAKMLYSAITAAGSYSVVFQVPMWPFAGGQPTYNRYPVDWCLGPRELEIKRKEEARLAGKDSTEAR